MVFNHARRSGHHLLPQTKKASKLADIFIVNVFDSNYNLKHSVYVGINNVLRQFRGEH